MPGVTRAVHQEVEVRGRTCAANRAVWTLSSADENVILGNCWKALDLSTKV